MSRVKDGLLALVYGFHGLGVDEAGGFCKLLVDIERKLVMC